MMLEEKTKKIEHDPNQPQIPDNIYRLLVNGVSRSGKTNALLNSRSDRPDIDKTYLYAKDISEPKYKLLIKKRHGVGLK